MRYEIGMRRKESDGRTKAAKNNNKTQRTHTLVRKLDNAKRVKVRIHINTNKQKLYRLHPYVAMCLLKIIKKRSRKDPGQKQHQQNARNDGNEKSKHKLSSAQEYSNDALTACFT